MGFRWSQNILRSICWTGAGVSLVKLNWYFALPLMVVLIALANIIESFNTEIKQIE